jgi:predicted SAM-dependent methyltransferase
VALALSVKKVFMLSRLKNLLTRVVPPRLLTEVRVEAEFLMLNTANYCLPTRRSALSRARELRGLRLNVGGGPFNPVGWFNIDLLRTANLRIDIRRGLPIADSSCGFIFSEQLFEHLTLEELRKMLLDCYRVLEPGGAIRIAVPDLARFVRAYIEDDLQFIHDVWPIDVSSTELLNGLFYQPTHRFMHDFASMHRELCAAGFADVYRSAYRASRFPELNIDSDMPHRQLESLYVEALK